jgi:methionine-rich copper-binding protein CopC
MRKRLAMLGLVAVLALAGIAPAQAHAILVESRPAIGATVAAGAIPLWLRFNSRIDRARSRLTLIRADRSTQVLSIDDEGTDDVLLSQVTLPAGTYVVRWQVLAVDGHITRGDVPLTVSGGR